MKNFLGVILLVVVISNNLFSQIDREIQTYVDSTELLVKNGRKMMLKELNDNNLVKVKEIYEYLSSLTENNHFAAFYYLEDFYINMLTNDWNTVESAILDYEKYKNKILYPGCVELTQVLYEMTQKRIEQIEASCNQASINEQTKRIIEVLLQYIRNGNAEDSYNKRLTSYRKEFDNPQYEAFEKGFLPRKILKSAWNFSFGSGMVFATDGLSNSFSNGAMFSFGMDFNVQKVFTSLYFQGASLKLKEPFTVYSGIDTMKFEVDEKFPYLNFGLKGGYFLLRNEMFHIAPYLTVSGSSLKSDRYDEPEDNDLEYEVFNSFTYGAGLHTEIKLLDIPYRNYYYMGGMNQGYFSIKLEAGYNKILRFKDQYAKGDTPYFICSLVLGFGDF